jgi:hypothetical protein
LVKKKRNIVYKWPPVLFGTIANWTKLQNLMPTHFLMCKWSLTN